MIRLVRAAVVLAAGALVAGSASATTHDVPGDFATVADAVASGAVANGDTVRIADGTYDVDVPVVDKALTFVGTTPGATILTGNGQHRIFSDVTADITVKDLVFESAGSPDAIASYTYEGGAMRVEQDCHVIIDNCTFRNNKAGRGAAVMSYGDLTIRNSLFENNSNGHEYPLPLIYGGGVLVWNGSALVVENSVFRNNRAGSGGALGALGPATVRNSEFHDNFGHHNGGGLWVAGNVGVNDVLVEDCVFTGNWSSEGGGMNIGTKGTMTVRRCEFRNNTGGQLGGGIAVGKDGPALIEDCDFIENYAVGQGGPGIFVSYITNGATISNCYFKANEVVKALSGNGGGALWLIENSGFSEIRVEDCTFVENTAVRGSVAAIQDTGAGPFRPVFERCIMAHNTASFGSLYWCSLPSTQGNVATAFTDCTLVLENSPSDNLGCGSEGPDILTLGPDDTQVFCDGSYDSICTDSLAGSTECGVLGGLPSCGNCATPTETVTWGEVKSIFGGENARATAKEASRR